MSVSNMNPMHTDSKQIGLFDNKSYKLSITSQIVKLRRVCENTPTNRSQVWDRTYPSHLLDVVEALFRDVIVPYSSAVVYFTLDQDAEQFSLVVKIADPAEFSKSFADINPYFQVTIEVNEDASEKDIFKDCFIELCNHQDNLDIESFADAFVEVKPFSAGSQRKVIDNAIAYLGCNVNGDTDLTNHVETGNTGEGASFIDIEIPFGLKQKLVISIMYNFPDSEEE